MAGPGNILIKIGAEAGQAISELSRVDKSLGSTMTTSEKMGAGLRKAALPAAAALTALGFAAVDATKAAAEDAAAQEKLAGILKNAAGATDVQVKSTEDWITSISKATGVADDDLRPALANLAVATKDVGKAQELMNTALDISAATGKDVETVTKAMAKGYQGSTGALSKLVPGLSQASRESKDFNTIMGELANTTGGAMAASADTAAGRMAIFKNNTAELKESLGAALLPVMESFTGVLTKLTGFMSEHVGVVEAVIAAVAALAAGIVAANIVLKVYKGVQLAVEVATKAWTAAQWLLNAALDANPIGLVVIAIAAITAALIIAYTKSETFRTIVGTALGAVKTAAQAVAGAFDDVKAAAVTAFNWVTDHWKLALFFFGPVGAAVYLISSNFDAILGAAKSAWKWVTDKWTLSEFAFGPIEAAVRGIASAFDAVLAAANAVISAIQSAISWAAKIPHGIGGLVGKLNPFSRMVVPGVPSVAGFGRAASRAAPTGPSGVTVNVYGAVDPEGTARAIRRILSAQERRLGMAR